MSEDNTPLYVVKDGAYNDSGVYCPEPGTIVELHGGDLDEIDDDGDVMVIEVGKGLSSKGWLPPHFLRPLPELGDACCDDETDARYWDLFAYSEWLDSLGLIAPDQGPGTDDRSHDELVRDFLAEQAR